MNERVADVLELLLLNQQAIAAGVEELGLWVGARGSVEVQNNVSTAMATLDVNMRSITDAIEALRRT
ncbi:hypothetical protein [Pseudomonas japonica]|uniref:hypothetical protein n=1 Tax=Pseudomonas japonica TaxID=256466 RepID=UPI003A84A05F